MARRKNSAEAFEILRRIAEREAEARAGRLAQERARKARKRASSAAARSEDPRAGKGEPEPPTRPAGRGGGVNGSSPPAGSAEGLRPGAGSAPGEERAGGSRRGSRLRSAGLANVREPLLGGSHERGRVDGHGSGSRGLSRWKARPERWVGTRSRSPLRQRFEELRTDLDGVRGDHDTDRLECGSSWLSRGGSRDADKGGAARLGENLDAASVDAQCGGDRPGREEPLETFDRDRRRRIPNDRLPRAAPDQRALEVPAMAPVAPGPSGGAGELPARTAVGLFEAREPLPDALPEDDPEPDGGDPIEPTPLGEEEGYTDEPDTPAAAGFSKPAKSGPGGSSGDPSSSGPPELPEPAGDLGGGGPERRLRAAEPWRGPLERGSMSRAVRGLLAVAQWLVGDGVTLFLRRPIEMRVSTLVMGALSLTIVLALIGIYLKRPPKGDDFFSKNYSFGRPTGAVPSARGDDWSGAASVPAFHYEGALELPPERPLWSAGEMGTGSPVPSPGGRGGATSRTEGHPEFRRIRGARQDATAEAPPAVAPGGPWIRLRARMDKKECSELVAFLEGRLLPYVEEQDGCETTSIACKGVKAVDKSARGTMDWRVYIGPFESSSAAEGACSQLKTVTKLSAFVFNGKRGYFEDSYVTHEGP